MSKWQPSGAHGARILRDGVPTAVGVYNAYEQRYYESDQHWQQGGSAQFYIKRPDGKSTGKLALAWDAVAAANGAGTNNAGIRIRYTISPKASALSE